MQSITFNVSYWLAVDARVQYSSQQLSKPPRHPARHLERFSPLRHPTWTFASSQIPSQRQPTFSRRQRPPTKQTQFEFVSFSPSLFSRIDPFETSPICRSNIPSPNRTKRTSPPNNPIRAHQFPNNRLISRECSDF